MVGSLGRCSLLFCAVLLARFSMLSGGLPSTLQFIAQVGDGGGLRTVFLVMNPGGGTCHVTLVLNRYDGTPWALPLNGVSGPNVNVEIPPGGSVRLASPGQDATPTVGSARINSSDPVVAQAVFEIRNGGTLVTQAAVEAAGTLRNFDLFFDQTAGTGTGIAVMNTTGLPINLYISERAEDGSSGRAASITLAGGHQTAVFVSEVLGSEPRKGSLQIEATGPVAVTTLQQTGLVLTTLPVATRVLKSQ